MAEIAAIYDDSINDDFEQVNAEDVLDAEDVSVSSESEPEPQPKMAEDAERSSISSFNEVVFHNVMHQYPVEAHVECRFVCGGEVTPTAQDWVGLFKVGWTSTRNYATYSLVKPVPNERQATAFFMNKYLPKEEYEFYQFVYVTSNGLVKGASTPFRFCRPIGDDYVTEETEGSEGEEDILIVTSKTVALENALRQLNTEKAQLANAIERLECLRQEEAARADRLGLEKAQLATEVEELQAKIDSTCVQEKDTIRKIKCMREQLVAVHSTNEEKDAILKAKECRIADLESSLEVANANIRVNEEERIKLVADMKALRKALQDKEALLQKELQKGDELVRQLSETQCKATSREDADRQTIVKLQAELLITDRDRQEYRHKSRVLEGELEGTRNQLAAAEETIELHKVELAEHAVRCEEFEQALVQRDSLQQAEDTQRISEERFAELQSQLTAERQRADEERAMGNNRFEQLQCRHKCLEQAYTTIKERFLKAERRKDSSRVQLQEMITLNKDILQKEEVLRNRCTDLERRLKQGAIEYKKVYAKLRATRCSDERSLDGDVAADSVFDAPPEMLATPLTPLPPPIQPLKTSASKAYLAAIAGGDIGGGDLALAVFTKPEAASAVAVASAATDDDQFHDAVVQQPQPQAFALPPPNLVRPASSTPTTSMSLPRGPAPPAPADAETFHDAPEGQLCPVCGEAFPGEGVLERHVSAHFPTGMVCPVCHEEMPVDTPTEQYEQHVYAHFSN